MLFPSTLEMVAVDGEHLSHETTVVRIPGADFVPGGRYSLTIDQLEIPSDGPSDA